MNNLCDPYPVHITEQHIRRVPNIIKGWGTTEPIINLGIWDRGSKPDNMIVVNIERILDLENYETRIPYDPDHFKYCLCIGVLEHTKEPHVFVNEMFRILQPGGQIYVEVPFLEPFDPAHQDYFRFTPAGINYLFREFEVDEFGVANGPGSTLFWISRIYEALKFDRAGTIDALTSKMGSEDYLEATRIFGMAYEYMKETDEDLNDMEHATLISCSYYLLATKPGNTDDNIGGTMENQVKDLAKL